MSPKSRNQDCWEKYQQPQICEWYNSNVRKRRGTKEPPMRVKEQNEIVGLKLNIKKAKIMSSGPISSVQVSGSVASDSLRPHGLQHTRPPCPSPNPWACSNSSPLSQWCHPTISSSVVPFSSLLQSFLASGSFPMSLFFVSSGQSIGASASALVLPMNIQDRFPLGLTDLTSLKSKGLSLICYMHLKRKAVVQNTQHRIYYQWQLVPL